MRQCCHEGFFFFFSCQEWDIYTEFFRVIASPWHFRGTFVDLISWCKHSDLSREFRALQAVRAVAEAQSEQQLQARAEAGDMT